MKDINNKNKLNENLQGYFFELMLELINQRLIDEFIIFLILENPEYFIQKFLFHLAGNFRDFSGKKDEDGIEVIDD